MEKEIKTLYKYSWYKQKTYKKNDIEAIVDTNEILLLNKKHIK